MNNRRWSLVVAIGVAVTLLTLAFRGEKSGSAPPSTAADTEGTQQTLAKAIRLLFIGDSITQGTTANLKYFSKRKGRHGNFPRNGTCSYRFPLLTLLNEHVKRRACAAGGRVAAGCSTFDRVVSVGPFRGSFGGRPPSACKAIAGLMPEQVVAHAAVWGVRIDEMTNGKAAPRHAAMLRLVGLRGVPKAPAAASGTAGATAGGGEALLPPMRADGPRDWVAQYRPHLVLVLLGTNDLHAAEPSEVFSRLIALTNPLLAMAGGNGEDGAAKPSSSPCAFIVAISTLPLHFATEPTPPIEAYNALLKRFNATGRRHGYGPAGCPPPGTTNVSWLECSRCVRFIDGAGKAFAGETKESIAAVTYDAIHPNAEGEGRIAAAIFGELVAQALV